MDNILMWPSMTSEVILRLMINLRLYNLSIHIIFHRNRLINVYYNEKNLKFRIKVLPFWEMRCRRTYDLKKLERKVAWAIWDWHYLNLPVANEVILIKGKLAISYIFPWCCNNSIYRSFFAIDMVYNRSTYYLVKG